MKRLYEVLSVLNDAKNDAKNDVENDVENDIKKANNSKDMFFKQVLGSTSKECLDIAVRGIEQDSRRVKEGYIFVAIRGYRKDGHKYINDAIKRGACCIIVEFSYYELNENKLKALGVVIVVHKNPKRALALITKYYYNNPSSKLKLIGITGTNGKTTITYMLKRIFETAGKKVGVIGTISNYICGKEKASEVTTPDSISLNKTLSQMVSEGVEYCFMEVSSHALAQERAYGLNFDIVLITNITEDHFDYHKTMEEYYKAKKKIFSLLKGSTKRVKLAIYNKEIYKSKELQKHIEELGLEHRSYGVGADADYKAYDIKSMFGGGSFKLEHKGGDKARALGDKAGAFVFIEVSLSGKFNIQNSLGAYIISYFLGIGLKDIKRGLKGVRVPGRFEVIKHTNGAYVIIDYAHTDDALKNVLEAIKELSKGRIICVFGCGGNRDKSKRVLMGRVAAKYSDLSIITSDNPRKEGPETIIKDILKAYSKEDNYIKITNRYEAIKEALKLSKKDDIVLIAGKGHEDYQILHNKTIHFSDREVVLGLKSD